MSTTVLKNNGWLLLLGLCQQCTSETQLERLLHLLLTPEEKSDLSKRCLIIRALLENKMTQREISKTFDVSISKITRGSNELKGIDENLKKELMAFFKIEGGTS
jgi:TrpR family transcriptional regulator, trp operon repressor